MGFEIQERKDIINCQTAYIFKGLGRNLIPIEPNKQQLENMKILVKEMLDNKGDNSDEESIKNVMGSNPKIGLNLSLMERKLVNTLSIIIANSTLMDLIQKNKCFLKKGWSDKIKPINYNNMLSFKVPIRSINKLFGRSICEKIGKSNITIIQQLSSKKFFLINYKREIKYQKAFPMKVKNEDLIFSFHPFLIGATYDKRKDFFKDIKSSYEAIFFEFLFNKTKNFKKKPIEHLYFTTRSLLKDLGMEELARTHKQKTIKILNTCFRKAFEKGIFTECFMYSNEKKLFDRQDKTLINLKINPEFKWY